MNKNSKGLWRWGEMKLVEHCYHVVRAASRLMSVDLIFASISAQSVVRNREVATGTLALLMLLDIVSLTRALPKSEMLPARWTV